MIKKEQTIEIFGGNIMWIICGGLSVIFCIVGYLMLLKKNRVAYWASLCSLSFTSLTLLSEYKMVMNWVNANDWSALLDVVPLMYPILTGYLIIMLLANAAIIGVMMKK